VPLTHTKNQFSNKKALEVCNLAIEKFPDSNGANKCKNLKNTIIRPALQITNEKYIEPNKASKILVSYKNMDQLYFRILKIAPNSALETLKSTKAQIFTISSSRSLCATRSFFIISLLVSAIIIFLIFRINRFLL